MEDFHIDKPKCVLTTIPGQPTCFKCHVVLKSGSHGVVSPQQLLSLLVALGHLFAKHWSAVGLGWSGTFAHSIAINKRPRSIRPHRRLGSVLGFYQRESRYFAGHSFQSVVCSSILVVPTTSQVEPTSPPPPHRNLGPPWLDAGWRSDPPGSNRTPSPSQGQPQLCTSCVYGWHTVLHTNMETIGKQNTSLWYNFTCNSTMLQTYQHPQAYCYVVTMLQ